jgi:dTDP-4-dehydrorhamnose 3,5-epimerase
MEIRAVDIGGAFVIGIEPQRDPRGFFARTYCAETFAGAGMPFGAIRQTSLSHNRSRGTLRGMHFQAEPYPEAKLVRVASGRIYDVIVDLRRRSPTYLAWFGIELDAVDHQALLVPAGCAHGFLTLADDSVVTYAMDADYDPALARGVRWDDPSFAIAWPLRPDFISERDRTWPDFRAS